MWPYPHLEPRVQATKKQLMIDLTSNMDYILGIYIYIIGGHVS
jgi:hypothetical protein